MKIALIAGWGFQASVWPLEFFQDQGCQPQVFDFSQAEQAMQTEPRDFDYLIGWSLGGVVALQWGLLCSAQVIVLASLPVMVQRMDFCGGINAYAFHSFTQQLHQDKYAALQNFVRLQALGCTQQRWVRQHLTTHLCAVEALPDLQSLLLADARLAWQQLQRQQRLQAVFAEQDALLNKMGVQQALQTLPAVPVQWIAGGHAQPTLFPSDWKALLRSNCRLGVL